MRVFVAGGTGALGRPLVRALVDGRHEVFVLTRRPERRAIVKELGAQVVLGNALDAPGLKRAVGAVGPTHVVHLLTSLPPEGPLRPKDVASTDRLRVEGTANLLRASAAAGVRRLVAESFMGVYGTGGGDDPFQEDDLPPVPRRASLRDSILALRMLEQALGDARDAGTLETVVLRYGLVYGPEVGSSVGLAERLRKRQVFVPKGADGVASFIHAEDAARATRAALEASDPSAVYNVVDDEPAPLVEYLTRFAELLGAPPPWTVPRLFLRTAAPILAEGFFSQLRLSNGRARSELGWAPKYPTLREGLLQVAAALKEKERT